MYIIYTYAIKVFIMVNLKHLMVKDKKVLACPQSKTHEAGNIPVPASVDFLLSYRESLESSGSVLPLDSKGKQEIQREGNPVGVHLHHSSRPARSWEPPQEGWTKVNVDGSYLEQSGEAGVGAVARDANGNVTFMARKFFETCGSAVEAEALACTEGLRWAHQWGLSQVILESDCARTISSL